MKISAIVVTYNRLFLLKECIEAIRAQTRKVDEIIVVNNSSTDGTLEWLQSQSDLTVVTQKNSGGAGGFNTGMKLAYKNGHDWLWVMDDDCIPYSDSLEKLVRHIHLIPNIAYLGSKIIDKNNDFTNIPSIDFGGKSSNSLNWGSYIELSIIKINRATFVSLLINSSVVKKCGFPIKDLFIWGDDTEFTLRLAKSFPAFLVGDSIVKHKCDSQNWGIDNEFNPDRVARYRFHYRNRIFIIRKSSSLNFIINEFILIIKMFLKLLFRNQIKKIILMIRALVEGLFFNPKIEYPD